MNLTHLHYISYGKINILKQNPTGPHVKLEDMIF